MSELSLIAEEIREAMTTLEKTQEAGNHLVEDLTEENYAAFLSQMSEMCERLQRLKQMLARGDAVASDELADALARSFDRPESEYRRVDAHG
ncbi:MAG: hypothetical protein QY329_10115 [Anaerolineales bacterium]|nr:MAG: hypothetical protein QY329_10115 [Anaerolineales bacterium]